MFEFIKKALDQIALPVYQRINVPLGFTGAQGRDAGCAAVDPHKIDNSLCVIATIRDKHTPLSQSFDQGRHRRYIRSLAGAQCKA